MEGNRLGREKKITGKIGENAALVFLKERGYKILGTNIRTPFGELDIIAGMGDFIIFVEVKTRATSSLGPPYLSITRKKSRHLIKNALCYLKRLDLVYSNWRIDIVSVKLNMDRRVEDIEIIENAVQEDNY